MLIPNTAVEVGLALAQARAAGRPVHIRSGERVTHADVLQEENAAVVSLEALNSIEIELQEIRVGPAATVGDLATALQHRALFLPLPDQPTISLAAAVLGSHRPPFPRSVGNRPLADGVIEAEIVPTDPEVEGAPRTLDLARWRRFRAKPEGVVTRLVIDTSRWAAYGVNRWLRAWMVPYTKESFASLCDRLFGRPAPRGVDLNVRVSSGAYGERLIVLRATGQERERGERTRKFVETALSRAQCPVLWSTRVDGAGAALAAWVGAGPGRATAGEVHVRLTADSPWLHEKEVDFLNQVDALVGAGAWVDMPLLRGTLFRRALVPALAATEAGVLIPTPTTARTALASVALVAAIPLTHAGGPIPGFRGEVFERAVGDRAYWNAVDQYAVSSFDDATIAARMTPRLVAVAKDPDDVVAAVAWAAAEGLKVVARSGGHQYCGLSSGGHNTVLVDLRLMNKVAIGAGGTVTVGPGVRLRRLSGKLRDNGLSLPHGECPLVNLGGHIQTGGVGHQLRSLGLTLDWVREFEMVGWGATAQLANHRYPRPDPLNPRPTDAVFAAVLGGGPGSWGLLTSITFDAVKDNPNAPAYGYTRTYPYNRAGWAAAFEQLRVWSERQHQGTLPDGVDLFLSVISADTELLPNAVLRPAILLVETTALSPEGQAEVRSVVDAVAAQVSWIDWVAGGALDLARGSPNGKHELSHIVHHGVRSTGAIGGMPGGREFGYPYRKSLYVSRVPLSEAFCNGFVDLVDRVNRHPDLKVVFQGVIGGGRFTSNAGPATRMQHRNALVQLVFDVFYRKGHAHTAEGFQEEMRALWEDLPGESNRMFWGTYEDSGTNGAQLDMSKPQTRDMYYDSPAVYAELQQIKALVDPSDVFHTSFTVHNK